MKITETFKKTLNSNGKFLTLSLTLTLFEKCLKIFNEYGISPNTLSFLVTGFEKINEELKEGYLYLKDKETFNDITKEFKKENNG